MPRNRYLTASGSYFAKISFNVKKFPRLLDIFSLSILMKPLWSQYLTYGLSVAPSDCAISHSWWGKVKSIPPPWMSKVSPSKCIPIALHSMCHPGRPSPHGLGHEGSPGLAFFQSTKSCGWRFLSSASTREPARSSSCFWWLNLP